MMRAAEYARLVDKCERELRQRRNRFIFWMAMVYATLYALLIAGMVLLGA
jgi:hypothetical protein